MFKTVEQNTSAELVEKKSKFISNLIYINNQEEAENIIKEMKKKYHDARHNCMAYRVIDNGTIIEKYSDDGEPSGTAGAPMLDILRKKNLCNVLVIVTRYFGGILLGTGGLVRAYSDSTIQAIEKANIIEKTLGYEARVNLSYNEIENFKYYCSNNKILITNMQYMDVIICKIELDENSKEKLLEDIDKKRINVEDIQVLCEKVINKI